MKYYILGSLMILCTLGMSQSQEVRIIKDDSGMRLEVDGQAIMINGMNWDYFPIGTNYTYSLWTQPESLIKAALDEEMALLQNMGVNVIRQYTGVPAKWITYIYEKYGIYTMLNHSFGRYGLTIDGAWVANTEYADKRTQELLLKEVKVLAEEYKQTPGLLMYLLGNENNYGLFWAGAETEDFPDEEEQMAFIGETRARPMYHLMNDASLAIKTIDPSHPVAICNGDLLFANIVAEECTDIDIYGTNMYRGASFGDAFQRVKDELNLPIMFTEFGADAFNAISNQEDQESQACYMLENWKEIYLNASGLGLSGNSIGGFTFQFSDGWWKFGQTKNLEYHDNNASWANAGYARDFEDGENNMNEEWFGLCAKGPTNPSGLYHLYPRAAYYALKQAHKTNPFTPGATSLSIQDRFNNILIMDAVLQARGDKAALESQSAKKLRISQLRAEFTTFSTGGDLISTPKDPDPTNEVYPSFQGFDHMESYFVGIEAHPSPNIQANVDFNVLGNVATNPINEIFYENRGRPVRITTPNGIETLADNNRVQVYRAEAKWNHRWFDLDFFYRTGHYHWGYEGDFFGLYPEANYGPNIDIYNGEAPFGFQIDGKKSLKGLTFAFGPELWWGANPAFLLKYTRTLGHIKWTGIYHEDIANAAPAVSSIAVPQPKTRRLTLQAERKLGKFGLQAGAIWGGQPLNGRVFQLERDGEVFVDEISSEDNWGGKLKFTYEGGRFNWYAQAAAQGLVANGGSDQTRTFTGWRLKDNGLGNKYNVLTGFTFLVGNLQIAPNFMWQQPIEGPIPSSIAAPGRPRNIIDDPFAVRGNRETVAGELLLTYDPTPSTWMYDWDNDRKEDAKLAVSAGFVFRHLPTTQDAAIGILADGRSTFAFDGAPPAKDLWEAHMKVASKLSNEFGIIANVYGGPSQANGSNPRTVKRFGADLRMIYKQWKITSAIKTNDWGPFDYYRDFNQTYPLQLLLDISLTAGKPDWFILPNTRLGVQGIYRTLDQYSPRYCPTKTLDANGIEVCEPDAIGFDNGNEWEIRTYLHISIGR